MCWTGNGDARLLVKTLVPWFGGNRTNAKFVSKLIGNKFNHITVPFAGGCPELLYMTANTVIVGDLHSQLLSLCFVVSKPELCKELIKRLEGTLYHERLLLDSQRRLQTWEKGSLVDLAYDFFLCSWLSRNGLAGTDNEFSGPISYRRDGIGGDSAVRFVSAVRSIRTWQSVFKRCTFLVSDCFDLLESALDRSDNAIYCDPPFPDAGESYKHKFTDADQAKLAASVRRFKNTRVVMRFYDHPIVRALYPAPAWTWYHVPGRKSSNNTGNEVYLVRN